MKKIVVVIVLLSLCLQLVGCATMSGRGATAGATIGGLLGAAFGGRGGAIIGAVTGAMIGAILGHQYDRRIAERDAAARRYAYDYHEEMIAVEGTTVMPFHAEPDSAVEARIQYTILAPDARRLVKVSETRALVIGDQQFLLSKREVFRKQGTYISAIKFTVPRDLPEGNYTLVTRVSNGKQARSVATPLKIG